jgi:hypothetical protein
MKKKVVSLRAGEFALDIDNGGHFRKIRFDDVEKTLPVIWTAYEIDGRTAEVQHLPQAKQLSFRLSVGDRSGALVVAAGGEADERGAGSKEITLGFQSHQDAGPQKVGFSLFFPEESVFHLAEYRNIGRRLDRTMPFGEAYSALLNYNMLLVDLGGMWLRLRTNHNHFNSAEAEIVRHESTFGLTYSWGADSQAALALFSSMEEALSDFSGWISRRHNAGKLGAARNIPDWIHNVRLVITADMLRSNWEVTNRYEDVARLCRELHEMGCSQDTLIYIPGWHGAYDAMGPTYRPQPELGGEDGFRRMIDEAHRHGCRVMIHTTGWGIDPYHPDIDRLEELVVRDESGRIKGWQINETWLPGKRSLRFETDAAPLSVKRGVKAASFDTPPIPSRCEALLTVGGVGQVSGRIQLRNGRRSIISPPRWFETHSEYDYIYPLLLEPGVNPIQLEYLGDGEGPEPGIWYRIRYAFMPRSPYSSWTWPILVADTSNPEYIKVFTDSVSRAVKDFGIDAVHVDATWFDRPGMPPARDLYLTLQEKLEGVPICAEAVLAFEEMGFFVLAQACTQSLLGAARGRRAPTEQGSVTLKEGVEELYAWLSKESRVCSFSKDFFRSYPHLCAANAFVPLGKVCNIFPARRVPLTSDEHWRILRDAQRLDYVPGLRINYREYGLDEETARAIREIAGWK